jgi:hypothetical protein
MSRFTCWHTRGFRLSVAPLAVAACLSLSAVAIAAPTAKDKAAARTLAADGRKALKDKRWAAAITALEKADALDPGPMLEVDLARAQIGAGKLVEAGETLAAVVAGAESTPSARKAREAAKKIRDSLKTRIAKVRVRVTGAPAGKATVRIDDEEVDASSSISLNPGHHDIRAAARGFVAAEREVTLPEGAHEAITLELDPVPVAVVPVVAVAAEEKKTGTRAPGAVVTAFGGAGLVVGGIFGALAFGKTSAAKSTCNGDVCPPAASATIATSKTYGDVSTAAFIAGGALVATGVVLLISPPGAGGTSDDADKSAAVPRVSPWVGPGVAGVGVIGRF